MARARATSAEEWSAVWTVVVVWRVAESTVRARQAAREGGNCNKWRTTSVKNKKGLTGKWFESFGKLTL